jgi:pre-mRNA-processing factor 19
MLTLFQNEWDALTLENFELRQQTHQARVELSHALYEIDSTKRVLARLVRERDEARQQLANVQVTGLPVALLASPAKAPASPKKQTDDMQVDSAGALSAAVTSEIDAKSAEYAFLLLVWANSSVDYRNRDASERRPKHTQSRMMLLHMLSARLCSL